MARPWKFKEPLNHIIKIRCTSEERKYFHEMAMSSGLSISDVLRRKLLGLKIPDKTHLFILYAVKNLEGQVRKIGGLIKHIYSESPEYSEATSLLLREQEMALKEITFFLQKMNKNDN